MRKTINLIIFIVLVIGAILTFGMDNSAITYWVSDHHTLVGDYFFRYWTHMGDGLILIPVFFFLFTQRFRYLIMVALASIFHLIGVFLSKEVYFRGADWVRPGGKLDTARLQLVEGVDIHSSYTFPSGHTATAFLVAAALTIIFQKYQRSWWGYFFAALVGISRVYLYQHWFKDIWAGAALGVGSVLLAVLICDQFGDWADQRWIVYGRKF